MNKNTHIAGGVLFATSLSLVFHKDPVSAAVYGAFGALLVDIDHPGSWIGRRLSLISPVINKYFGHRKITHSLLMVAILCMPMMFMKETIIPYYLFFLSGYISHIFYDMLTPAGVPLFYPFLYKRTGSKISHKKFSFYPKFMGALDPKIPKGNGFYVRLSEYLVLTLTIFLIIYIQIPKEWMNIEQFATIGESLKALNIGEFFKKLVV